MRLFDQKGFPKLKKSYSTSKNLITLSKVELDKNLASIEPPNSNFLTRQTTSASHQRIGSGFNPRQSVQSQMSKTFRNLGDLGARQLKIDPFNKQKNISISSFVPISKDNIERSQPTPQIDKAKYSIKCIGSIKAYSVNSHSGVHSTNNEDRICIITNLNKSIGRDSQISFFSIYDGHNGVAKAQYFRDHFHNTLIKDKDFFKDFESSIKRSILILEEGYLKSIRDNENIQISSTKLLVCIVMDNFLYLISLGDNKMVVSSDFGEKIKNPLANRLFGVRKDSGRVRKLPKLSDITLIKLEIKGLDFIALGRQGGEGLFENFNEIEIARKIWTDFLTRPTQDIHQNLGQTVNEIMKQTFEAGSSKNVSVIIIVFENVQKCFQEDNEIDLPYINTFVNSTQLI